MRLSLSSASCPASLDEFIQQSLIFLIHAVCLLFIERKIDAQPAALLCAFR